MSCWLAKTFPPLWTYKYLPGKFFYKNGEGALWVDIPANIFFQTCVQRVQKNSLD